MSKKLHIVGELMNNSYARARRAFTGRDPKGYQELAKLQSCLRCRFPHAESRWHAALQVRRQEMLEFLPEVIPAIQEGYGHAHRLRQSFGRIPPGGACALRPRQKRRADSELARRVARTAR